MFKLIPQMETDQMIDQDDFYRFLSQKNAVEVIISPIKPFKKQVQRTSPKVELLINLSINVPKYVFILKICKTKKFSILTRK